MMRRRILGAVVVLAVGLGGCGGSAPCVSGPQPDGTTTIAIAGQCLEGVTGRVLVGGTWRDATFAVEPVAGGTLVTFHANIAPDVGPVQAFELVIPHARGDRLLEQGYQSWSFSGAMKIPADVPLAADGEPELKAAATGDVFDEVAGVSYGSAVVGGASGPYLAIGALTSAHASTGIAVTDDGAGGATVRILYGAARENLGLGVVTSEPIALIGADEPNAGLDALRELMPAPDGFSPKRPPGGWFSWNEKYDAIDQAYVRANLAALVGVGDGFQLFEIDDGWEQAWGDWTANARFTDGMDALASEITAAGYVPGIWLAPFLVDTKSAAAQAIDPMLLVRDAAGKPIVHKYTGSLRSYYVLDGSNPASMKLATDAIAALAAAGYRFFKLDFLYAGALPGQRANTVTGVEAMRNGLTLVRQAAGPDAMINACGAPIFPLLGLVDSMRIGPDTAFRTTQMALAMVTSPARSYAARSYLFPRVWPDADQTQVRAVYEPGLAQVSATVAALAGPAYSLGDDLTALPAARLALATEPTVLDLAAAKIPARPADLLATPTDAVIVSPLVEAVLTSAYTNAPPPREFDATGASGKRYHLHFTWDAPQSVAITQE